MQVILPSNSPSHNPLCVNASYSLSCRVIQLVLPGATKAGLNASILPESLNYSSQFTSHEAFFCRTGQNKQLPSIILKRNSIRRTVLKFMSYTKRVQVLTSPLTLTTYRNMKTTIFRAGNLF